MMEREINLLPPHVTQVRTARIYLSRLGRLTRFAIFLAIVLFAVIGMAYLVVWRTHQLIASEADHESERQVKVITQVQKVNAQLAAIAAWRTENVAWTPLVPEVLQVMPAGIELTSIGVTSAKQLLEVRGTFTRREILVAWQRRLEELAWVEKVESPLSNFQTGSNAQFSLLVFRKGGI